jgi:hypothetical protein
MCSRAAAVGAMRCGSDREYRLDQRIASEPEMMKVTGPDIGKSSSSGDQMHTDDRLVETFAISKKMRPFVRRMRMRIKDFDLTDPAMASQFASSVEEMRAVLAKKKIPDAKIKHAIDETVAAAADHRLQDMRLRDSQRDRVRSAHSVEKLIEDLTQLAQTIGKLPPVARNKLNAIVAGHTAQYFDTETIAAIVCDIAGTLPKLAPTKRARDAFDIIDQPMAGVNRSSPPKIVELWETMPAETRRQVEQKIRHSVAKRSATEFLRQLVVMLGRFLPQAKLGRLPTIQRHYAERVGKIWQALGLRVGRAYDGIGAKSIESNFQRYCRFALAAVGDESQISGRQVRQVKSDLPKKADSTYKRVK